MTNSSQAIDVHAHYGNYERTNAPSLIGQFCSGDARTVVQRALDVNISTTIVSPLAALLPRGQSNTYSGNQEAFEVVSNTPGLLQWAVINPLESRSFAQAEELLATPKCVGIKLHPEEHVYPISEHGNALFEFAAKHNAVVLVHSGDPYSLPEDFVPYANRHPNISIILAHLGNGGGASGDPTLQVRAVQQAQHGNIFTDTSSARSLAPNLIEWAVSEIGAEKILFGTDTPLYFTAMQKIRIDEAAISTAQKQQILWDNAVNLWDAELFERNAAC